MYLASYSSSQNQQTLLLQANALKQARDNAKHDDASFKNTANNLCQNQASTNTQATLGTNTIHKSNLIPNNSTQCLLNTQANNVLNNSYKLLQQGLGPLNYNSLTSLLSRSDFIASINKNLLNNNLQSSNDFDFNLELLTLATALKHISHINNVGQNQASSLYIDDSAIIYALFLFISVENIKRKTKKKSFNLLLNKQKAYKQKSKEQNGNNQAFHEALLV